MRKYLSISIVSAFLLTGCFKNEQPEPCTAKTVESEMPVMTKFATDSAIATTQDASGLLYQIIEPGTGTTPTASSNVTVNYTGRLMNGTKFDESLDGTVRFPLNGVIPAWTIALQKIKAGGKIKIITPSKLAYSCVYDPRFAQVNNQPLYFYVELLSVQ